MQIETILNCDDNENCPCKYIDYADGEPIMYRCSLFDIDITNPDTIALASIRPLICIQRKPRILMNED